MSSDLFLRDRNNPDFIYKVLGFVSGDSGEINPDKTKVINVLAVCQDANGEIQSINVDGLVGEKDFKEIPHSEIKKGFRHR